MTTWIWSLWLVLLWLVFFHRFYEFYLNYWVSGFDGIEWFAHAQWRSNFDKCNETRWWYETKQKKKVLQFNWDFEPLLAANNIYDCDIHRYTTLLVFNFVKLLQVLFIAFTNENFYLASNWNLYFWVSKKNCIEALSLWKVEIIPGKLIRIKWFWLFLLLMPLTSISCDSQLVRWNGTEIAKSSLLIHFLKAFYVINLCESYLGDHFSCCSRISTTSMGWITVFLPFKRKCIQNYVILNIWIIKRLEVLFVETVFTFSHQRVAIEKVLVSYRINSAMLQNLSKNNAEWIAKFNQKFTKFVLLYGACTVVLGSVGYFAFLSPL